MHDLIVVGAGAAGAALAARLSENPHRSVLLLEAGPVPGRTEDFPPDLLDAGTLQGARPDHPNNWSFLGHLTPKLPYSIARGRILGGSTTINGGYFIRARREDFDRWSAGGNDEWSYEKILPVYRRLEADAQFGESAEHGRSGPMRITRQRQDHPATVAFRAAAAELGFPLEPDKNDDQGEPGFGPVPVNIVDGIRWNTGIAYLNPVRHRPNLTVQGGTLVRRLAFDGTRAVGVEVESAGQISNIRGGEIVLAAGAVKTPHLLLLSGIGPRAELEAAGVAVIRDSPQVGKGFSDHPEVSIGWRPRRGIPNAPADQVLTSVLNFTAEDSDFVGDLEILQIIKPTGHLLTGQPHLARGLGMSLRNPIRSLKSVRGISLRRLGQQLAHQGDLSFIVGVQAETSRGEISLVSADPAVAPRIDYNYLSTPSDRTRMRQAIRTTVRILRSKAFASVSRRLTEIDDRTLADDALLDRWMLTHLGTAIHLCGSCSFGAADDAAAVVDQYGRVRGVDGLRIADTSILPTTPTRGPAATAILIGELVADFIERGK